MKVAIEVTVDVDPVMWDLNYGTGSDAAAVRADVKEAARQAVLAHFEMQGVLTR